MPKRTGLRRHRAADLLRTARIGPSFDHFIKGRKLTPQECKEHYRLWSTTYLLSGLIQLIPELKGTKPDTITAVPVEED
jgi:hypothetical protein